MFQGIVKNGTLVHLSFEKCRVGDQCVDSEYFFHLVQLAIVKIGGDVGSWVGDADDWW